MTLQTNSTSISKQRIHKIISGDTQAPKPEILAPIADCFTEALEIDKSSVDDLIKIERNLVTLAGSRRSYLFKVR